MAPAHRLRLDVARRNAAFRDAIDELAGSAGDDDEAALDAFLGRIVREITALLDLPSAVLWQHDTPPHTARLRLMSRSGQILPARSSGHVSPTAPLSIGSAAWLQHMARRPHLETVATHDALDESQRAQFAAEGVVAYLNLPLMARGESLGSITVRVPRGREVTTEEMEAAQSLANHAALALLLEQHATRTRTLAVAQQRAEELAKANQLLRRSVELLTSLADLDRFFGEVLLTLTAHLGSPGATVWLFDSEGSTLHLCALDGHVYADPPGKDGARLTRRIPRHEGTERQRAMLLGMTHYFDEAATTRDDIDPSTAAWMKRHGAEGLLVLPMKVAKDVVGCMCVHKPDRVPFSAELTELAIALSQQAALALHAARLAESNRDAALAREREENVRRENELLKRASEAQQAMHESLGMLTDVARLDTLLSQVLKTVVECLDEASGGLWLVDHGSDGYRLYLTMEDGSVVRAESSAHPAADDAVTRLQPGRERFLERGGWVHGPHEIATMPEYEAFRPYLAARGIRSILSIPLFAGETFLGTITVRGQRETFPSQDLAFAKALASQASMALHIARLAEQAKQVAVIREREAAARGEVAELVKINAAIQGTLSRLANQPDLQLFLTHLLVETEKQLGAISIALFQVTESGGHFSLIQFIKASVALDVSSDASLATFQHPVPFDESPAASESFHRGDVVLADVSRGHDDPLMWPRSVAFHRAMGHRSVLAVPLQLGGRLLGFIGAGFTHDVEHLTARKIETARALAHQTTLAMELSRLAEHAKDAAIAREQEIAAEARAAELAKANEALARSTAVLSAQGDLESYLRTMFGILLEQMGEDSGTLWRLGDDGEFHLALEIVAGLHVAREDSTHPAAHAPIVPGAANRALPESQSVQGRRMAVVFADLATAQAYEAHEATRRYLLEQGVRAQLIVPLFSGARHLGSFVVRSARARTWTPEQIELAQALGNQATLAMELTRLSAQEREAAITRERLATMSRTNLALRATAEKLAEQPTLDSFLGQTLQALVESFGGEGGTFWQWDGTSSRMLVESEAGIVKSSAETEHPDRLRLAPESPQQHLVQDALMRGHIVALDVSTEPALGATTRDYLRTRGIGTLVSVPLKLGERHLGSFTIRVAESRQLEAHERELASALATQAAVAIELTRLAEEAKEAAVAREREEAAHRRAAELTSVNEAMRATLTALTEQTDLDKFLEGVLVAICRELAAPGADLWLYEPGANAVVFHTACIGGAATHDPQPAAPGRKFPRRYPFDAVETADILRGQHRFETNFLEIVATLDADGHDFYAGHGVRSVLRVPVAVGANVIGNIAIWKTDTTPFLPAQLGLALAMGQQAALAIHTERLAEQAKQSAVAAERERVAEERVAELTRANRALSRTIDTLARERSVDAFLATTMGAIAEALDSTSMTLWSYEGGFAHLHLVYEDGHAIPGAESSHPNAHVPIFISSGLHTEPDGALRRAPVILRVGDHPMWTLEQVEYLRARGVRALIEGVMIVEDRVVGTFTARLLDGQPDPPPARMSLVQALASQAALAIEMTRLADQARAGAVVEERNRLARDIHDTLAQGLAAIVQQLEAAAAATPATADSHLTLAMSIARDSFVEARRSIRALRPRDLARGSLVEALGSLVRREHALARAQIAFTTSGAPAALPAEVEDELLRIAAEAMTNTAKHAAATHVTVDLAYEGAAARLTVRDDGVGFDVEAAHGRGVGLGSMRERAARVGAVATFASEPGNGAEVIVFWTPHVKRRTT